MTTPADILAVLVPRLAKMTEGQLGLLTLIIDTFDQPTTRNFNPKSDVVDEKFSIAFGDFLKLHHSLSAAYLDKTRFEVALERILGALGHDAKRPRSGTNRGHDITVDGAQWSLKTHGDKNIKNDYLFISKFMELGSGNWGDSDLSDLAGLRDQFLHHLRGYERIFQLRYFHSEAGGFSKETHRYELVEIPKAMLLEALTGKLSWAERSKTNPRCGYCEIADKYGQIKFRLYFDGGGERKLQLKDIDKKLCVVHGSWTFSPTTPLANPDAS